ncbi:MAG: hypothetical protein JSU87_11490 [Gemmatimonadota bacterium]|nr:MAG: hypothetical protein JSU87_11490 [Gemmatimonadota bacterium]
MANKPQQVDPERLRRSLLRLAQEIIRLEKDGELLHAAPVLIRMMGNLRSQLFEWEVRCTGRLLPRGEPPEILEAQRIVEEAARRLEQEDDEDWWRRMQNDPDEDED